jgi:transmembrane sensor
MEKLSKLKTMSSRHDEASIWLARLDRGLTKDEERELNLWMAASKQNRGAVLNVAKVWDRMDALSRLSEIFPRNPRQKSDLSWRGMALVASFLIVLSLGLWGVSEFSNSQNTTAMNGRSSVSLPRDIFETGIGEHSTVSLQDGTRVSLKTDSVVRGEYTPWVRRGVFWRGVWRGGV